MAATDLKIGDTSESLFIGKGEQPAWLTLGLANRHGLVTGATGTGKTASLQVMAEGFTRAGVPVFAADIKGDLSGISEVGEAKDFILKRAKDMGLAFQPPIAMPCSAPVSAPARTVTAIAPGRPSDRLAMKIMAEIVAVVANASDTKAPDTMIRVMPTATMPTKIMEVRIALALSSVKKPCVVSAAQRMAIAIATAMPGSRIRIAEADDINPHPPPQRCASCPTAA